MSEVSTGNAKDPACLRQKSQYNLYLTLYPFLKSINVPYFNWQIIPVVGVLIHLEKLG